MTPEDVLITMGVVFGVCVLWGAIWGLDRDRVAGTLVGGYLGFLLSIATGVVMVTLHFLGKVW